MLTIVRAITLTATESTKKQYGSLFQLNYLFKAKNGKKEEIRHEAFEKGNP